ncbi:transcriptional regulator [Humibacter sp. BT305]|nr:transcriptional regulator [Humibacter sp. BT305]
MSDAPSRETSRVTHPRHATDAVLTAPIRLSIVAALSRVDEMEFAALRDLIELSDSALSKQVSALEDAGYVEVRKGYVGKRPRTWLRVSPDGRAALRRHLAALTAIVEGA